MGLKKTALVAAALLAMAVPPTAHGTDLLKQGKDLLGKSGLFGGGEDSAATSGGLSVEQISAGLKEALRVGTETVVQNLGAVDGFNGDEAIRIPLPQSLQTVQDTLAKFGLGGLMDDLHLRLNRAAEAATPKAKALFQQAITDMTLEDVKAIYEGPADSATRYFQSKMSAPLADAMRPIVDQTLNEVGAIQAYDSAMAQYKELPLVPDVKADLSSHVLSEGMEGIFHYVAIEEQAIRENPVKRTTEILKTVFGGDG